MNIKPEVRTIDGVIYKQCTNCKEYKHIGKDYFFHPLGFLNTQSRCKECQNIYQKKDRADNPARYARLQRNRRLKNQYQINRETFDELSKNGCHSCGRKDSQICVDHDHETGKIRGILCTQCNVALGSLQDSEDLILKLAAYIRERSREDFKIERIEQVEQVERIRDSSSRSDRSKMARIVAKARGISVLEAMEILKKTGAIE